MGQDAWSFAKQGSAALHWPPPSKARAVQSPTQFMLQMQAPSSVYHNGEGGEGGGGGGQGGEGGACMAASSVYQGGEGEGGGGGGEPARATGRAESSSSKATEPRLLLSWGRTALLARCPEAAPERGARCPSSSQQALHRRRGARTTSSRGGREVQE